MNKVELSKNDKKTYAQIKRSYEKKTLPDKVVSSTLPRGEGNNRGWRTRVYVGRGATLDSTNG